MIAKKAVDDHRNTVSGLPTSPDLLLSLANMGSQGLHPQHCHEQLLALVQKLMPNMIHPAPFTCTMKSLKRREGERLDVDIEHCLVNPFEYFAYLWEHHPVKFAKQFLGCESAESAGDALQGWWGQLLPDDPRKQMVEEACMHRDDIAGPQDIWRRCVPISLHGDAVPLGKTSLDTVSWSGVYMNTMPTIDFKILCSCLVTRCKGISTDSTFWKVLVWGLNVLMGGRYPHADYEGQHYQPGTVEADRAGQYLAGGLFCTLWTIKSDMDYLSNNLGLEHSSGRMKCPWCLANVFEDPDDQYAGALNLPIAPWNDLEPSAAWRGTVWEDPVSWRAFHGGQAELHPIFSIPGVSILNVAADTMHIVCLGVAHHVVGNAMFELCFLPQFFPGVGTPQARCDELWHRIAGQYRARGTPTQLSNLALAFFCNAKSPAADFPLLTSRVKAAETRHLVPIMASIWGDVCDSDGSQHDKHVLVVLRSLAEFYALLDGPDYRLPARDQASLETCIAQVLGHYRALSHEAILNGVNRWHEVPKHHYLWHIGLQSRLANPRWAWCYPDEDFMRIIKLIGGKCLSGTATTKVAPKVVEKWLVGSLWRLRCSGL